MSVSAGGTSQSQTNFVVAAAATVANSRATYVGNGSTQQYTIPFPYLLPAHVWVLINGVPIAFPQWQFLSPTLISLGSAPVNGVVIEIRRVTPLNPLVTFTDGAVLPAADLNLATLQNLYILQEFNDLYMNSLNGALSSISSYGGLLSVNPQQLIDQVAAQVLGSALVASLSQRISDIDDSAEAILNNAITDSNFQTQFNQMYVNNGVTAAAITTEATVRNSADTALATSITNLTAVGGAVTAAIATESTARISGDSANASSITTLSTTVSGHTASIATQATSISGLNAQYTVKVDVNGRVAGYGLASTATTSGALSSFVVIANQFSVVDPGSTGSAPIVPFSIVGGVVYMQNVVIASALIQSLVVDKLIAGSLTAAIVQNADMNAGTGRIIWDNGTYMKVIGVGFGSTSQFIEWYGPHQASFASCTEANAIQYLKTNGDAYYSGKLPPIVTKSFGTGSGTVYAPFGTSSCTVRCFGGGGSGASGLNSAVSTGGGGGGGLSQKTFRVVAGDSFSYSVGPGGIAVLAPGAGSTNGNAGTASTVSGTANGVAISMSGNGGSAGTGAAGGAGGTASGGDSNVSGSAGTFVGVNGGVGGNAATGGGHGGQGVTGTGHVGEPEGGGGSGGYGAGNSSGAGGAGAIYFSFN